MPFCTIVEFEWDETFDREGFARTIGGAGGETPHPDGRLSQISGIDEKGARVIEVWRVSCLDYCLACCV